MLTFVQLWRQHPDLQVFFPSRVAARRERAQTTAISFKTANSPRGAEIVTSALFRIFSFCSLGDLGVLAVSSGPRHSDFFRSSDITRVHLSRRSGICGQMPQIKVIGRLKLGMWRFGRCLEVLWCLELGIWSFSVSVRLPQRAVA